MNSLNPVIRTLSFIALALILAGCNKIESTSYDPDLTITANNLDQLWFSVKGPAISDQKRYKWTRRSYNFGTVVDRPVTLVEDHSTREILYIAGEDLTQSSFVEITCELQIVDKFNSNDVVTQWITADSITWEIKNPQIKADSVIDSSVVIINPNDLLDIEEATSIEGDLVVHALSFPASPFLQDIETVGGRLIINDLDDIASLSEIGLDLSNTELDGFTLTDNQLLTDISGLGNLTRVNGYLHVSSNYTLAGLQGLSQLTHADRARINYNSNLTDLQGLNNLTTVEDRFDIISQFELENLSGLNNLQSAGAINLQHNANLKNLEGLENLQSLGDLYVQGSHRMESFLGFSLSELDGDLYISIFNYTDSPAPFAGLESLRHIGGNLELSHINNIADLQGFNNLETIGGDFHVHRSSDLFSFQGLDSLVTIGGSLNIEQNEELASLDGLEALQQAGEVRLMYNQNLGSIVGIAHVDTSGLMLIFGSQLLTDIPGFNNIESLSGLTIYSTGISTISGFNNLHTVFGEMRLLANENLSSMHGFQSLVSADALEINRSHALIDLQGLDQLQTVNGYVKVWENDSLLTVAGLENLASVAGLFSVSKNPSLTSVNQLVSLGSVDGHFSVNQNPQLCESEAQALVDQVESMNGIGGDIFVYSNNDC